MTSLALVPSPAEATLARLGDLRRRLDAGTVDFAEALDVRDQAEVVRAYVRSARLGLELANSAIETRLRAERKAGVILLAMIAAAGPSTTRFYRRGEKIISVPSSGERQVLPGNTLRELGISARDSSRYQLLAQIDQREFDARIAAITAAGRLLGFLPFERAATQYKRMPGGRPSTTAASLLRRALRLLKDVVVIRTHDELELARQVVRIGESWSTVVNAPPPSSSPQAVAREISCILCGRAQPLSKPSRCPACQGAWLET